jgi:hypothetical protein
MEPIKIIIDSPTGEPIKVQILGVNDFVFSYSGENEIIQSTLTKHYKDICKNIICEYDANKDTTYIYANNAQI